MKRRRGRATIGARLAKGPALILDGATGTELERRGCRTGLPLWSTHALLEVPETVEAIHRDYVAAGAEVLIANTFRTQARTLARAGSDAEDTIADDALTKRAVDLARAAAKTGSHPVLVAGSAPPLEDCYRPDRVPDDTALLAEHERHAMLLAEAGVDFVMVETMNTIREATAAAAAASKAGLDFVASFVCWDGPRLLSGERLIDACRRVADLGPVALGVNCLPPSNVNPCLEVLLRMPLPCGVYANLGEPEDERGFRRSEDERPGRFAERAEQWVGHGARFVGGCCGTTPDHIRAVAERCTEP